MRRRGSARPDGGPCRKRGINETRLLPSLSHVVPYGASQPFSVLPNSFVNHLALALASIFPRPRVLSSTGITRLPRYYNPLRHPKKPVPRLMAPPLASRPRGFPCCTQPLFRTCRRHYPGGTVGYPCRSLPQTAAAFPVLQAGRLPHYPFRGLLSVHRTLLRPARSRSPLRTLTRSFDRLVASTAVLVTTCWNDPCRVGFAPTEVVHLCTAH